MVATLRLQVYTDGACSLQRGGKGGWAWCYELGGNVHSNSGALEPTTNNQMELMAVIQAFIEIDPELPLDVYSDSQYVVKGLNDWIYGWKKKGWKTATGDPVKNKELWDWLWDVSRNRDFELKWVKGHYGHPMNELADQLAVKAANYG